MHSCEQLRGKADYPERKFFMVSPENDRHQHWRLEDIDFDGIDPALVHDDEILFYMLASASFVEIMSELYSSNLIEHFRGNVEVVTWLEKDWQREEVQHGRALKTYVQKAWPEFNWDVANEAFQAEYTASCTAQQLEPSHALEMVARCVVETGTTTLYNALCDYVKEPVLLSLLTHIKADETNHYLHFRQYFEAYNDSERQGAWAVIAATWRRLNVIRAEDTYIAFKHAHACRHPGKQFCESEWRRYNKMLGAHARIHYPYMMAFKMLSKPIPLSALNKRLLKWPLIGLARFVLSR